MSFDFIILQLIVQLNQFICFGFFFFSSVLPNSLWPTSVLTFALSNKIMVQWTLSKPLLYIYLFIVLHCQIAVLENHSTLLFVFSFFLILFHLGNWGMWPQRKQKFLSEERGKRKGAMLFENGKKKSVSHIFLLSIIK